MLNHQDRLFDLLDSMEMTKSEHDWLELRFANMTEKERLLFTGALEQMCIRDSSYTMRRIVEDLDG